MKSYRATENGYLSDEGRYVIAGEVFQTNAKPGNWMEPLDEKEAVKLDAIAVALDPSRDADPNLADMTVVQLQVLAADRKIPFKGLSKPDLVAALQAEHGDTA